jgi:hypothetical protein
MMKGAVTVTQAATRLAMRASPIARSKNNRFRSSDTSTLASPRRHGPHARTIF